MNVNWDATGIAHRSGARARDTSDGEGGGTDAGAGRRRSPFPVAASAADVASERQGRSAGGRIETDQRGVGGVACRRRRQTARNMPQRPAQS